MKLNDHTDKMGSKKSNNDETVFEEDLSGRVINITSAGDEVSKNNPVPVSILKEGDTIIETNFQ